MKLADILLIFLLWLVVSLTWTPDAAVLVSVKDSSQGQGGPYVPQFGEEIACRALIDGQKSDVGGRCVCSEPVNPSTADLATWDIDTDYTPGQGWDWPDTTNQAYECTYSSSHEKWGIGGDVTSNADFVVADSGWSGNGDIDHVLNTTGGPLFFYDHKIDDNPIEDQNSRSRCYRYYKRYQNNQPVPQAPDQDMKHWHNQGLTNVGWQLQTSEDGSGTINWNWPDFADGATTYWDSRLVSCTLTTTGNPPHPPPDLSCKSGAPDELNIAHMEEDIGDGWGARIEWCADTTVQNGIYTYTEITIRSRIVLSNGDWYIMDNTYDAGTGSPNLFNNADTANYQRTYFDSSLAVGGSQQTSHYMVATFTENRFTGGTDQWIGCSPEVEGVTKCPIAGGDGY